MTSVRRLNLWCKATAGVLAVGAAGVVAAALWLPFHIPLASARASTLRLQPARVDAVAGLTMEDFEPLLTGCLGWPEKPPPAPPAPVIEAPAPQPIEQPPALQLLGTITATADLGYAVFQTAQGVELKRAGETVADGRVVVEVTEGAAVVREGEGEAQTLRVPPPPPPPPAGGSS
jgi:hypothetical protein